MNNMSKLEPPGFTDHTPVPEVWGEPDMSVIQTRRAPPTLSLEAFGPAWAGWISKAAEAAAAPPDYVAMPLLAAASALIGNARWAQASPGWKEPPNLWLGVVGDSGCSKTPGAACILRDVLPEIERRMIGDFPERIAAWHAAAETDKAREERWRSDVKEAQKTSNPPPMPPANQAGPEPQVPRLRQNDVTEEKSASLLATAAPKGLLIVRDELAGWLLGMTTYNDAGRAFWLESWGGGPYRVERQKHPEPIMVDHLTVAVTGGTQPERLAEMSKGSDDGLMARLAWSWPDPKPFRLSHAVPDTAFAIEALDKLRLLEMIRPEAEGPLAPVYVPLTAGALAMMEAFGQDMQQRQQSASGLLRSAYGKARGMALRLALTLEMLRWCAGKNQSPPPEQITEEALGDACDLVADYFMPMAARVYGDAAIPPTERNAATLARWIIQEKPHEVHVRNVQKDVRLPGMRSADAIRAACDELVEADWLRPPAKGAGYQARGKVAYPVNPALLAGRAS